MSKTSLENMDRKYKWFSEMCVALLRELRSSSTSLLFRWIDSRNGSDEGVDLGNSSP